MPTYICRECGNHFQSDKDINHVECPLCGEDDPMWFEIDGNPQDQQPCNRIFQNRFNPGMSLDQFLSLCGTPAGDIPLEEILKMSPEELEALKNSKD